MELKEVGLAHRTPQGQDELTRVYSPVLREYHGILKVTVRLCLFSMLVAPRYYQVLTTTDLRHLKDVTD